MAANVGGYRIDLNQYIKKSHLRMVEKFNQDLEAFRNETEAEAAELYEDANTSFTLANVRVENGCLVYEYDGREESDSMLVYDDDEKEFFEEDIYGIAYTIKFWRACLKRAKRYWSMSPDKLDKIQDGLIEDKETED